MKKGINFALLTAVISGISIFVNSFAAKASSNVYVFTTTKNLLVSLLLISTIIFFKKYKKIKQLNRKDWLNLILIGLIGGGIPFLLFFKGLTISTEAAASGAFIHKTLFIWVALISFVFLKEKLSVFQYSALTVIMFGIYLLGGPQNLTLGVGEILILSATLLWSIEAMLVKRLFRKMDTSIAAFGRMFFGSLIMIAYLLFSNNFSAIFAQNTKSMGLIILTSLFLLLYVFFYYKALQKEKATIVTSILTLAFPITIALKNVNSGTANTESILGILIISAGVIALIYFSKLYRKKTVQKLES